MEAQIVINKEPSFREVWREGYVEYLGHKYYFWLIDPEGADEKGEEYEMEVRWFFKRVPMEVRQMATQIIETFKTKNDDNRNKNGRQDNSLPSA